MTGLALILPERMDQWEISSMRIAAATRSRINE